MLTLEVSKAEAVLLKRSVTSLLGSAEMLSSESRTSATKIPDSRRRVVMVLYYTLLAFSDTLMLAGLNLRPCPSPPPLLASGEDATVAGQPPSDSACDHLEC